MVNWLTVKLCQWERFFFSDNQEPLNEEAVFTSEWVNNVCIKETRLPLELMLGQTCLYCSRQQDTSHQFTMKYSFQLSLIMFLGMRSKPNANSPFHKSFMIWWTTLSLPSEVESTGGGWRYDMLIKSVYNTVEALRRISHLGTIIPSTAKILILGDCVWDVWLLVFLLWPLSQAYIASLLFFWLC